MKTYQPLPPAGDINALHTGDNQSVYSLSIVVPVYCSQSILPKLVELIHEEMNKLDLLDKFELILINDASPDKSWDVILQLSENKPYIKGISLRRNFGQHNAIMAGLKQAKGQIIVIMDDDGQHPASAIGQMITAIKSPQDVCYTHYINRQHQLWKKLGSLINDKVATLILGKPSGLYLSSFKALRREIAAEIIRYDGPYPYIDGLILDITRSITSIDIEHQSRLQGHGNYDLSKSISLWLKMATGFSVMPLRFASIAGLIISACSFIMMIFVIIQKLLHPELTVGWSSLISVNLFIGGIQILCLGMIGEYLARSYLKINHKPQFVVRETTWDKSAHE